MQASNTNLELIHEQSNEHEGTADAEKKSLIGQTIQEMKSSAQHGNAGAVKSDQISIVEQVDYLQAPQAPKRQFTTATDEASPLRQESKQTLLSGLTSQNNARSKFESESSYANNIQNKLNSNYLANRLQMTGALSKHTLGETYDISEDIHMSNSANDQMSGKMITTVHSN